MPLETFTGSDIAALLEHAKRALGADAVLLSMRRVRNGRGAGFEVTAADPATAREHRSTAHAGKAADAAARAVPIEATGAPRLTGSPFRPRLLSMNPLLTTPGARRRREPVVLAMLGPTGSGKTTTIAKLARHPRVFDGLPVGLLCLDTYRIGAVEQLRIYAEIAGLQLEVAYETRELARAMKRLRGCEIVLVDTAGRGPSAKRDMAETREQICALAPAEVHLTLPAGLRPEAARHMVSSHRAYGITHLLATKLDEFPEDTAVFELAAEQGLPMRWYTDGQEVPMDLRHAAPRLLEWVGDASANRAEGALAT
jgi:flagellar biosynthesis protein FlhF